MPDLVVIDGGKGQVSAAREVMDAMGLFDMPLVGLAKEREEMFLPGINRPDRAARQLRRRSTWSSDCATRRTALRSPITASCARKAQTKSVFDEMPGVGPARKRALLRVFGSAKQMRGRAWTRSRPCRASAERRASTKGRASWQLPGTLERLPSTCSRRGIERLIAISLL